MKEIILIFALALCQISLQDDPIVELPNGQVLGREGVTSEEKTYYAFQGIPYGKAPVGDLRFQPPQPVEDWDGVVNATGNVVQCYQLQVFGGNTQPQSEDCLYLHVYTPTIGEREDPLAVMIFIHGGAFTGGSGADAQPDLFINNDVVLVSINYRLGVFGFISTQDEVIPGNNGLKDQLLAIQWTQDNIALFGGDPSRITIFGQSAGGGSRAHHVLNQNSADLLHGIILESGTFLSTGMFQRNPRQIAFGTGAILDSSFEDSEDSQALLEFFLGLEAEDLNDAAAEYNSQTEEAWDNFLEVGSVFAPVVEPENPDAFLTEKMYGLLKEGKVGVVPTMMGFCGEEKSGSGQQLVGFVDELDERLELLVPVDVPTSDKDERKALGEKIRDIYTNGESLADHLGAAIKFSSDNFLSRPMIRHAELYSSIAPTYFFQFNVSEASIPGTDFGDGAGTVGHGSELGFLFCSGDACFSDDLSETIIVTRRRMAELWTNFAKYQNPTPENSDVLQNVVWPKVSTEDGDFFYLNIGEDLEVFNHPKEGTYQKWVDLYEGLDYDDYDTY